MREGRFGPSLRVIAVDGVEEASVCVKSREKPLALYLVTTSAHNQHRILTECSFGGGCVNDTIGHLATSHMGFGGVGHSGMGSYHGKKSFDTFSHHKSILQKANWLDLPVRYHPYTAWKDKLLHMLLR